MDLDPASWGGLELGQKIGPVKTSNARSFNHFPIKLAKLIARQLITGTVIPFHIHNVVVQLHENGELRSAELSDIV